MVVIAKYNTNCQYIIFHTTAVTENISSCFQLQVEMAILMECLAYNNCFFASDVTRSNLDLAE